MMATHPPSLEEFMEAPTEQVASVAPTTMVLAPGGTRREAVLAGISLRSEGYPRWSRERMIMCVDQLFGLGVRHLFMTVLRFPQLAETGHYRERLIDWIDEGIAGPDALADYTRSGWRVRLVGVDSVPELQLTAGRLYESTPGCAKHTLWVYVCGAPDAHWTSLLAAAHQAQARTRIEVAHALYGEDIPPATLCISFGKPFIAADILPLVLADEVQCYWTQRPGFALDEALIRQIFYDYAYTRRTWQLDKSARYVDVPDQRESWEQAPVLGLGQRVGGFWYPTRATLERAE